MEIAKNPKVIHVPAMGLGQAVLRVQLAVFTLIPTISDVHDERDKLQFTRGVLLRMPAFELRTLAYVITHLNRFALGLRPHSASSILVTFASGSFTVYGAEC